MKNLLYILFVFSSFVSYGQGRNQKFEAKKIAWLTTKLQLSTDEAKVFWPIYNDYTKELSSLRKERAKEVISFRKTQEIDNYSDEQIQELIQNDFDFRQKNLNIERKYYNRFKSELPLKVIGKFYRAQEAYKKEILQQYRATAN